MIQHRPDDHHDACNRFLGTHLPIISSSMMITSDRMMERCVYISVSEDDDNVRSH